MEGFSEYRLSGGSSMSETLLQSQRQQRQQGGKTREKRSRPEGDDSISRGLRSSQQGQQQSRSTKRQRRSDRQTTQGVQVKAKRSNGMCPPNSMQLVPLQSRHWYVVIFARWWIRLGTSVWTLMGSSGRGWTWTTTSWWIPSTSATERVHLWRSCQKTVRLHKELLLRYTKVLRSMSTPRSTFVLEYAGHWKHSMAPRTPFDGAWYVLW